MQYTYTFSAKQRDYVIVEHYRVTAINAATALTYAMRTWAQDHPNLVPKVRSVSQPLSEVV